MPDFHIYIMSSPSRTLYIGMTNNIERRVWEHKQKRLPGFTARYNVTMLVYCEAYAVPLEAIAREKELKGWLRRRKVELIEAENPDWQDLSRDWYE
ncbi:MAG: GIY-YIG nuclease family protein [Thermomicrobiales bacterium]|nr:GIY-YIG nuclease family protein [Thermomicrobiales bacterium]